MSERNQEKIGWIGGWLGGFVWVVILSIILLVNEQTLPAATGFFIAGLGCTTVVFLAPWRHPHTPYWVLMAPVYLLFLVAVGWGAWSWGGWRQMGVTSWWSALILLPIFIPFWLIGGRRWEDGRSTDKR